jgi:hypothetical protein
MRTLSTLRRAAIVPLALSLAALACDAPSFNAQPTLPPGMLYRDDFSDSSSGWATGSDSTSSLDYTDGQYVFNITKSKWYTWGNLDEEKFENARIEVEIENKSSTQEPTFGIICNYTDESNNYYAGFGSDGYYAIVRTEGGTDYFLTDPNNDPENGQWLPSDDITVGATKYTLAFECANGQLKLEVDGVTIATAEDATFKSGQIGLFVLTFDEPTADVRFDDIRVLEVK